VPRTTSANRTSGRGGGRRAGGTSDTHSIITQVSQLVAANDRLQREHQELTEENQRLRSELLEIGSALGGLTGAPPRGRRGRAGVALPALPEAGVRRQRKPITDPQALENRRLALAKARAVRAERLAAARATTTETAESAG
jgi:hypothetical protein